MYITWDYRCSLYHNNKAWELSVSESEYKKVSDLHDELKNMYVDEYSLISINNYNNKLEEYNKVKDKYNSSVDKYNDYLIKNCKKN